VASRDVLGEDLRGAGRPRTGDVDDVLDGDRLPVQRAVRRGVCLVERLLPYADEGVQVRVPFDSLEVVLDRLAGGELRPHGAISGGIRSSRSRKGGRITSRKLPTASRSSSVGETPCK